MDFNGKVAIVTGGSKGIGYGISENLALKGVKVYLVARREEDLKNARERIIGAGGKAEIRQGDITNYDSMTGIIENVYLENNRLDIFVNNAGEWKMQNFGEGVEKLRNMRALTRDGPTEITEYLIHRFRDIGELKILNVVSQAGLRFLPGNLGYGVGKMNFAVNLLILQGQMEFEKVKNIDLYGLYPGTVATEGVLEAIKRGELENATSLESVVECAIDLISDITPTKHAYIGYVPGKGITRIDYKVEPEKYFIFPKEGEEVIDSDFNPKDLID